MASLYSDNIVRHIISACWQADEFIHQPEVPDLMAPGKGSWPYPDQGDFVVWSYNAKKTFVLVNPLLPDQQFYQFLPHNPFHSENPYVPATSDQYYLMADMPPRKMTNGVLINWNSIIFPAESTLFWYEVTIFLFLCIITHFDYTLTTQLCLHFVYTLTTLWLHFDYMTTLWLQSNFVFVLYTTVAHCCRIKLCWGMNYYIFCYYYMNTSLAEDHGCVPIH